MKITNLAIATTCLLGIVLGNFIDSAEARSRKRYSSRATNETEVESSFSLIEELVNDSNSDKNLGLFKGVITDFQLYETPIDTGNIRNPFDFDAASSNISNIKEKVALADLQVELIENANITTKLGWTRDPSFTGNILNYKFLNSQGGKEIYNVYLLNDPLYLRDSVLGSPPNFNEDRAINSFQDIFTNNWLNWARTEKEAKGNVEFTDVIPSPLSGPLLERSESDTSVSVPEANSTNALILFGILGTSFVLKRIR